MQVATLVHSSPPPRNLLKSRLITIFSMNYRLQCLVGPFLAIGGRETRAHRHKVEASIKRKLCLQENQSALKSRNSNMKQRLQIVINVSAASAMAFSERN